MSPLQSLTSSIAGIDTALSLTRELWMAATDPKEKANYRGKIDGLLDQRLPLMVERDRVAAVVAVKKPARRVRKPKVGDSA